MLELLLSCLSVLLTLAAVSHTTGSQAAFDRNSKPLTQTGLGLDNDYCDGYTVYQPPRA